MYLESIATLSQKEELLKQQNAECAALAKKAVADAKAAGQQQVFDAVQRANEETRALMAKAEENAAATAKEKAAETENKKAALRTRAESRKGQAVAFIVERIVNG